MTEINKCPYCYNTLGTWLKDPILLPNGSKYKWEDETTLVEETELENRLYKGAYQLIISEIKEIQDYLRQLEEENLSVEERTEFSPLTDENEENTDSKFQVKGIHLKEMRESVEKLLDSNGLTLSDFFNYDDAANYITHPLGDKTNWTDDVVNEEDWDNFQIKAIHIEELRHYLDLFWLETWDENATAKTYASASVTFPGGAYSVPIAILSDEIIAGDRTDWYLKTHAIGGIPPTYAPGYLSSIGTGTGTGYVSIVNPATNKFKVYLEIISQYFSAGEAWISTDDLIEAGIENVINKRIGENTYFSFNVTNLELLASSSNPSYLFASSTANVRLVLKEVNPSDSSQFQYYYIRYSASSLHPDGLTPTPTSYDITITVSQESFQNFNRNLYNDLSLLTTYPRWEGSSIYVIGIYELGAGVSIGALSYPSPIPTRTVRATYNIDNLKIYNLRT